MRPSLTKLAGVLLLCAAFPAHALDSVSPELGRGDYRLQHLSNAGTSQPNDGINFNQIRFSYYFDATLN